jgi:hypothetical protein
MEPIARHNRRPPFASSLAYAGAALALTFGIAACVPAPDSTPAPTPTPTPVSRAPAPAPAPAPVPTYDNWMDAPQTRGDWAYNDLGFGTQALFSDGPTMKLVMQCLVDDPASETKRIAIGRPGNFSEATQFRIATETTSRSLPARAFKFGPTSGAAVFLNANDPLLDAMALTKGRFAVETTGHPTLYLPAWAEVTRVIEDCR